MEKRKLGRSDIEVSLVGLGANNFGGRTDLEASRLVIHRALDLGITLIDTADIYGNRGGSEEILEHFPLRTKHILRVPGSWHILRA